MPMDRDIVQLMEFKFTHVNACFNEDVAIFIIDGNVPRYLLLKPVSLNRPSVAVCTEAIHSPLPFPIVWRTAVPSVHF